MRLRVPMPQPLSDLAATPSEPVPTRDAATVVLLRDAARGVEVYLMRRQPSMAFAPGMDVFPGGGVDPRDSDVTIEWVGPEPGAWAERFSCDLETARALVCAAVRETFEETGVLLAGPDAGMVVADTSGEDWAADRVALESRALSFSAFLQERQLVLRTDLLAAWTHWITPEFEPRRFDTRFFVALLPDGQRVGTMAREADRAGWTAVSDAIASVDAGTTAMLPPTYVTCHELLGLHRAADALAAAAERLIVPILPTLVTDGDEQFLDAELP